MADAIHRVIENISYSPSVQDTTDLEAATKTITATVEATGLANRDYQAALTLAAPTDARFVVNRIAARLAATIDSMTAATLYGRVYVDAQDADHLLFDLSWTTTGAKLAAQDTLVGTKEVIFNLLKDGAAHTFYFFFWVNAGNAVLSLVELWEGVGTSSTTPADQYPLTVNHIGFTGGYIQITTVGTGSASGRWGITTGGLYIKALAHGENLLSTELMRNSYFFWGGSVATDLDYLGAISLNLRTE